jgi:hypothetical protein
VILLFSTKTRASYKLEQKSSICVPSFESVGSYRDLHQTKLRSNNAREFFFDFTVSWAAGQPTKISWISWGCARDEEDAS